MADAIGLYYKTGGVESGGTNALTGKRLGGTRISVADAESAAFAFPALDTVYTLYYKAEDDATFLDQSKDTNAAFTITAPTGVQVCTTWNGTFASTASCAAAVGAFKPVYVKQTARQTSAEADIQVGTGGVTFTTGTRVGQVGTVTPTTGDAQVALDWADVTDADYYEIDRATNSGFTTNLVNVQTETNNLTTSAYTNTGLTNDTTYYYRVRACSELGVGAWSATASATPIGVGRVFTQDYASESLDTNEVTTSVVSGSASVTGGELVLKTTAAAQGSLARYAVQIDESRNERFTITAHGGPDTSNGVLVMIGIAQSASAPTPVTVTDVNTYKRVLMYQVIDGFSDGDVTILYRNSAGTGDVYLNTGTGAWTGNTSYEGTWGTSYRAIIETNTSSGVRVILKSSDGSTTYFTSDWVAWSTMRDDGTNPYWVFCGDPWTDYYYGRWSVASIQRERI